MAITYRNKTISIARIDQIAAVRTAHSSLDRWRDQSLWRMYAIKNASVERSQIIASGKRPQSCF